MGKGIPLGNVTSQLFANIYLNELDQFVKHKLKERYYIRYCDDLIILGGDQDYLWECVGGINYFLAGRLNLSLHPKKVIVRKYSQGIDFLGYVVLPHHRVLRTRTKRRLMRRVNEDNLPSYLGVLKHCCGHQITKEVFDKLTFRG